MVTLIVIWLLFSIIDDLCTSGSGSNTRYVEKKADGGRSVTRMREKKPDGTIIEGERRWTSGRSKEDDAFLGLRGSK